MSRELQCAYGIAYVCDFNLHCERASLPFGLINKAAVQPHFINIKDCIPTKKSVVRYN